MLPILLALVFIAIIFFVVIAGRPDEFIVSRSGKISAPPAIVFAQVNDFHKWQAWSPWAKMDPACKNTYDGTSAGVGAGFAWDGNKKVGAGRITILESRSSDLIRIKLEFLKPFKATNTAEFTFKPEGNQTFVTWSMTGKNNFFLKAFGLFMDCDKMVGGDFEKGLAAMKSVAEMSEK
jgi:polyketide cyclase/dehydrase/lipid transport protein